MNQQANKVKSSLLWELVLTNSNFPILCTQVLCNTPDKGSKKHAIWMCVLLLCIIYACNIHIWCSLDLCLIHIWRLLDSWFIHAGLKLAKTLYACFWLTWHMLDVLCFPDHIYVGLSIHTLWFSKSFVSSQIFFLDVYLLMQLVFFNNVQKDTDLTLILIDIF